MITNLSDFRKIVMLVDNSGNIVIFPISKTDKLFEDGENYIYYPAYHPIELNSTYTCEDLAFKIKEGIEEWDKHEPYDEKNSFEEKFYGIKGFKNASLGKKYFTLGWNDIEGKYVSLGLPLKKGYGYMGIESISLKDDADYLDFAEAVINLINLDLTKHSRFKVYRKMLNLE